MVPAAAPDQAFAGLARLLSVDPPPIAGLLRAQARAIRSADGRRAVAAWLSTRVEVPLTLAGLDDFAAPRPELLELARDGLEELRALMQQAPERRKEREGEKLQADARNLAASLSGVPSAALEAAAAPPQSPAPPRAEVVLPTRTARLVIPTPVSDEEAAQEKLAQRADLSSPPKNAEELARLEELAKNYKDLLEGPGATAPGRTQSNELKWASLDALRRLFEDMKSAPAPGAGTKPALAGTETERQVSKEVAKVEALKSSVQAQLAARDALAAMLAVADRARDSALRERRSGSDMLEFRKNFSRLAMVMDLSYSLNLLNSAQAALAGMQQLLDQKIAKIDAQKKANDANAASAAANKAKKDQWNKDAQDALDLDKQHTKDFGKLSDQAAQGVQRITEFKTGVTGLVAAINARDKGQSADAPSEYQRRLALLPQLQQKLIHGSGGGGTTDLTSLSMDYLKSKSAEISSDLSLLSGADAKLASTPVEFAGVLVLLVPGIPAVSASNPTVAQALQILADRKVYWAAQLKEHQDTLAGVNRALDPGNSKRVLNDFGDSIPESLVAYQNEENALASNIGQTSDAVASEIDALAPAVEQGAGTTLARLSGRSAQDLRDLLPKYVDQIDGLSFPGTDAGFSGKMAKLGIAKRLTFMGDMTVRRLEAQATSKALDKPITRILPAVRDAFTKSVAALQAIMSDIAADVAYVNAGFPQSQAQALIDRKTALVDSTLRPELQGLQQLLDQTLIPYQQDRIDLADPHATGDSLALLYQQKGDVYKKIYDGLHKTFPWGLASGGAKLGDVAGAKAGIAEVRKQFNDYRKLVNDLVDQIRRRKDPNNNETEDVYGEPAPYSLVKRAVVYQAEKVLRAGQINARDAQINDILGKMDALFPGKYNLASKYKMPTDLSATGADSVTRLKAMADGKVLQNMAADIKAIADAASAQAGKTDLNIGGSGGSIPTGPQPPLALQNLQQLALYGLDVVKRLVPTTATGTGDSVAEALARFLFSDALIVSANKNLNERIPLFEAFLNNATSALDAVFADLDADDAFVSGDLSGGDAVPDRKISIYTRIRDTAKEGAGIFQQKTSWDTESFQTVTDAAGYYDSLGQVYSSGDQALDADRKAAQQFKDTLTKAQDQIAKQKAEVTGWLKQLNDPHESALRRVTENLSAIQDKTRAVLETNIEHHKLTDQYAAAKKTLEESLIAMQKEQALLSKKLEAVGDLRQLSPELANRVQAVSGQGSSWLATGPGGPQTIVIPKSMFSNFLSQLFGAISADSTARDIAGLREDILKNPMSLAQLLPNTKMVEVGTGSDGFYLVYQTEFSTPGGLETSSQMTMGNVLNLWGNNVSVIGHRFASPPSDGNAPFGDQGITVQVESLQGKNFVNYLDVTFHKFIQDIPPDLKVGSQVQEARMMIFDDFAMMLANGKLYFGAAGFADFAARDAANKPYYYGGNVKASVKFSEIMSLNAEESALFAKDPRKFLQTVNLDFTKFDPDLDKDFVIGAHGDNKFFRRDKVGVGFDLQKALETKDSFKVDFYLSRVTGTDDIQQNAVGATIVKGFSFDIDGTPVKTTIGGTGELGEKYNTLSGRVSFELPNQGLALSAQGKILGDASTYFVELRKKLGQNTDAFVSYGSRYVGLNDRLTLGAQTTFTLGELWRLVAGGAAEDLQGGQTLAKFNKSVDEFFKRSSPDERLVLELKRVFDADVGKKLLSLEIGQMTRDLKELQKAGAILDNVRMRGMIGFVTNPVGTGTAERATGGGFQVGTMTELTLTKSQKALIHDKILALFQEGLALQSRLLDITKAWQASLVELVESRWDMSLAAWMYANADDPVIRAEAQTRALSAADRHRQALLRYNALTGRGPDDTAILDELTPQDLEGFSALLQKALGSPDRLSDLISGLRGQMGVPEEGFNLMDYIPFFEKITFSLGVQLQDVLANQVIGAGVSLRLPIYDPAAKSNDKALRFQDRAIIAEMAGSLRDFRLKSRSERLIAESWDARFWQLQASAPAARSALADGIRQWRNGLIPPAELWARFRRWYWTTSGQLEARAQGSLKDAWSVMDGAQNADRAEDDYANAPEAPRRLSEAFDAAVGNSPNMEALAQRSQAASELMEAASHRFQKVSVDVNIGLNLTAAGVALLPAFGITGLGVFPIFNVALQPGELKELSMERRGGEAAMYSRLQEKVGGDLSLQLFQSYAAFRAARDSRDLYRDQIIPELERAQDGGAQRSLELDQARADLKHLEGEFAQARAQLNYLLGRPLDAGVALTDTMDEALAQLKDRLGKMDPLAASRDVLASRVKVARSVEQIVDKNLKVQDIRVEPISLIGRALGRLISALSGEGLASPELVALAREQTLTAERDLRSFDARLPAMRARWSFELAAAERGLKAVEGRTDGASRLSAIQLRNRIYGLKAMMMAYGGDGAKEQKQGSLPSSFAALKDALEVALGAESASPDVGDLRASVPQEAPFESNGTLRYYDLRQSLTKEPIGKQFVEGWIEVRLRSAATPPEALIALAKLQEEKADSLYKTELSLAKAKADILLSRLRLEVAIARGAQGEAAQSARKALERDFAEVAAHLRLPSGTTLDQFLTLIPAEDADLGAAADRYLSEAQALDLELLKRHLFQEGLPEEIAAARDPLSQMQANIIAERMSYKGFTPLAAFGLFQGRWVGGVFLEAPDPIKVMKSLEGILNDALRRELESQDRLKSLSLMLHSLMASVSDKVKLLEAERSRVEVARRNLMGAVERLRMRMGTEADVVAAQLEASAAHEEWVATVYALRLDFIRLVTELEALGYTGQASLSGGVSMTAPAAATGEKTPRQELLAYWAQRLLDEGFEKGQDSLLSGVSPKLRQSLKGELEKYRSSRRSQSLVLSKDFTPAEKLDLLTKVDLDGRRRRVESALEQILRELEAQSGGSAWTDLMGFLRSDVESQAVGAEGDVRRQQNEMQALRAAYWRAVPAPPAVEAAYARLSTLKDAVYEARQEALHHYLQQKLKPEDYVLKDKALEAYVKALIAYDNEVLKTFAMKEVGLDPRWTSGLNAMFGLRGSLERRRDMLRYGRGIVTLDGAITLGEVRMQALRASPEARDQIQPASESLAFLRAMRERWIAKPESLPALYEVKGGGETQWLTGKDLEWLKGRNQVVELGGKRFLLPPTFVGARPTTEDEARRAGGQEIVAGVDARREELEVLKARAEQRSRRQEVDAALEKSELALRVESGAKAGQYAGALSLAELRRMERQGKVLYFNKARDPRAGLRLPVHALAARWRSPDELVILVQVSGEALPAGTFPSLESLEASDYARLFQRAEFGKRGAGALLDEAANDELAARRKGWLNLKLEGFAYALDKDAEVAAVYMNQEELSTAREKAKDAKSLEHDWSFHLVSDLRLGLDGEGVVVSASGKGFSFKLGGGAALQWLEGEIWALEVDAQGRVARVFRSKEELEREAGAWWIEDMEGKVWKQTDKDISPIARLKRYIDPRTGLPVSLGRAILAQRLSKAESGLGANGRWAYMPQNWGNIILETPRGIIKTPIEMITGRDPNQEGYIGRVYMRQTDGGATVHRGALGKVVHFIDIFEILPDPVDRYYDPSQFPKRVDNDSPIKPGEWEHEKAPVSTDGKKDVHLGKGSLLREIGWAKEDLEDARGQIMGSFTGSVRKSFVESVRGRAGEYAETKVDHQTGRLAVENTLNAIGDRTDSDGIGQTVATPDHIAVDTVRVAVQVGLGAAQQKQRRKVYEAYRKKLEEAKPVPPPDDMRLIAEAELALARSEEARLALRAAADAATPKANLPGFPIVPRLFALAAFGR